MSTSVFIFNRRVWGGGGGRLVSPHHVRQQLLCSGVCSYTGNPKDIPLHFFPYVCVCVCVRACARVLNHRRTCLNSVAHTQSWWTVVIACNR